MGLNRGQAKPCIGALKSSQLYIGSAKAKKAYLGAARVYSAGNMVTYNVDVGVTYHEEVDEGESCLQPRSFTPAKAGWTFIGWRADGAASGSVVPGLVMGDGPVELNAVFAQAVTVTYYNTSAAAIKETKYKYWNNGAAAAPSFAIEQTTLPGWTARGWSTGTAASGGITYANGATFVRDSDITLYGMYQQAVTVTYYNGSTSPSRAAGTRYYCPGSGSVANPGFTLAQAALSGWTARGWSTSTAASGSITYANGAAFTRDSDITLYGMYQQAVTLSYSGNGATGGSTAAQTGYRYCNSNGQTLNASFTVAASGYARTGYLFTAWKSGSTTYSPGQAVAISSSMVLAAQWASTASVNFTYNGGIQTYTVPVTGLYLLVAYGARGGSMKGNGAGNGGYAHRYVPLTAGQTLYIVCGQDGGIGKQAATYNGGGAAGEGAPGGGATHIASRSGTLRQLGSTSGLYVVAGGGGGGGAYVEDNRCTGGSGGGDSGERGKYTLPNYGITPGGGGTQSAAGNGGGFGYGGSVASQYDGGGGGGGLYGGGYGGNYNGPCAGGGGSGYIGSTTTVYKGQTYTNGQTVGGNAGDCGTASIKLIAV